MSRLRLLRGSFGSRLSENQNLGGCCHQKTLGSRANLGELSPDVV